MEVRYGDGLLDSSLNAYMPYEGQSIGFKGETPLDVEGSTATLGVDGAGSLRSTMTFR